MSENDMPRPFTDRLIKGISIKKNLLKIQEAKSEQDEIEDDCQEIGNITYR